MYFFVDQDDFGLLILREALYNHTEQLEERASDPDANVFCQGFATFSLHSALLGHQ